MKLRSVVRRPTLALVGLLLGHAAVAQAGPSPEVGSVVQQPPLRVQILAGGGLGQFTSSDARQVADTAATWQLRTVFSTRTPLGAELAYVGHLQDVRAAGHDRPADLHGHGAEAALRVEAPVLTGRLRLAPFGFAGVGWTRYHLGAAPAAARPVIEPLGPGELGLQPGRRLSAADWAAVGSGSTDDDVLTLPVGAGLSLGYRRLALDARLTVRPALGEDRLAAALARSSDLATWAATLSLGYEL